MNATRGREQDPANLHGLAQSPYLNESAAAGGVVVWTIGALTALVLLGMSTVRFVAAQHFLVVLRRGRVVAVRRSGMTVVLPGLHRTVRVPRGQVRVDVWWVQATSSDGVVVTVNGSLLTEVREPERFAKHSGSPHTATERAAAACLAGYVGSRSLAELVHPGATALRELAGAIGERTARWGVRVTDLELSRMDVAVDDELLDWALARTAPRGGQAAGVPSNAANRNGGMSTMEVTRSTLPGKGTLHHCRTRGGQHFGVLVDGSAVDGSGHRRLLVYGSADLDVPAQTVILAQDEADQIAEILQSRSIADRLSALERRFAEVTGAP